MTFNVEPGGCKFSEDAAHFGSEASFSFLGLIEWKNTKPTLTSKETSRANLTEDQGTQEGRVLRTNLQDKIWKKRIMI